MMVLQLIILQHIKEPCLNSLEIFFSAPNGNILEVCTQVLNILNSFAASQQADWPKQHHLMDEHVDSSLDMADPKIFTFTGASASQFNRFCDLPYELQIAIWQEAAASVHFVELYDFKLELTRGPLGRKRDSLQDFTLLTPESFVPATRGHRGLLMACVDSRRAIIAAVGPGNFMPINYIVKYTGFDGRQVGALRKGYVPFDYERSYLCINGPLKQVEYVLAERSRFRTRTSLSLARHRLVDHIVGLDDLLPLVKNLAFVMEENVSRRIVETVPWAVVDPPEGRLSTQDFVSRFKMLQRLALVDPTALEKGRSENPRGVLTSLVLEASYDSQRPARTAPTIDTLWARWRETHRDELL